MLVITLLRVHICKALVNYKSITQFPMPTSAVSLEVVVGASPCLFSYMYVYMCVDPPGNQHLLVASVLCAICATLCKEIGITAIAVCLSYEVLFLKKVFKPLKIPEGDIIVIKLAESIQAFGIHPALAFVWRCESWGGPDIVCRWSLGGKDITDQTLTNILKVSDRI